MLTNQAVTSGGEQEHSNTQLPLSLALSLSFAFSLIPQDNTGRIIRPYVPLKCIRATG